MSYVIQSRKGEELNRMYVDDTPIHEWYRFVLSFPPHLVRDYITKFNLSSKDLLLDPFCGTGTTIVEGKKNGIPSMGWEANRISQFVASTKSDWSVDTEGLIDHAKVVSERALKVLTDQGIHDGLPFLTVSNQEVSTDNLLKLEEERQKLLIKNSISPLPLHKALVLLEAINYYESEEFTKYEKVAFAKLLVNSFSNLRFGPEVGVGKIKEDAAVVAPWVEAVAGMANDLQTPRIEESLDIFSHVILGDARENGKGLDMRKVNAVVTSPPYPNEKDYSRTTRLESVILGFINSSAELRSQKKEFLRSNTRGVYKDDQDDKWVKGNSLVNDISEEIEQRRISLGKTSGFEKRYPMVVRNYFGGMAKHLSELRPILSDGANLAYVVGDQASYLRVMIRTGKILGAIATDLGYEVIGREVFRTRFSTATQENLNEEVLLLRWPG